VIESYNIMFVERHFLLTSSINQAMRHMTFVCFSVLSLTLGLSKILFRRINFIICQFKEINRRRTPFVTTLRKKVCIEIGLRSEDAFKTR